MRVSRKASVETREDMVGRMKMEAWCGQLGEEHVCGNGYHGEKVSRKLSIGYPHCHSETPQSNNSTYRCRDFRLNVGVCS